MNNDQIAERYVALKNAEHWIKQVARETEMNSPLTNLEVKQALELLMKEHQKLSYVNADIEHRLI